MRPTTPMMKPLKRHPLAVAIWRALVLWALLALVAACTGNRKPDPPMVPDVVEVPVTKYVPVPDELAADCQNAAAREQTYSEAKRLALLRDEFLRECSERMRKIRALGKQ